jgi:hypothetical protein
MRLAFLFLLAMAQGFSANCLGALVDSRCYEAMERNVNPFEPSTAARDRNLEIRYCAPRAKTKTFAIVLEDETLTLDSTGNSKAAELVRRAGKKPYFVVAVTGEVNGEEVKVDSISLR